MILPRWVLRAGWAFHRAIYRVSGGRAGLETPSATRPGTLRLHTVGRRSGAPRTSFVYYVEDGESLVIVASNAGDDRPPAWWLNLEARPEAEVDLRGGRRSVRARRVEGAERDRLRQLAVAAYPAFAEYEAATARDIPIALLDPLEGGGDPPR
jgi:deazaflavin-dependent oxidoreductase (nitroreductase family)